MKDKILDFLKSQQIMTLSTVNTKHHPQSRPIFYVMGEGFDIYFVTHSNSRKVEDIKTNSAVSVSVWKHDKMSLQIEGKAELISDKKINSDMLDKLAQVPIEESSSLHPPILRVSQDSDYGVFKIKTNEVRHLDLSNANVQESKSAIEIIKL